MSSSLCGTRDSTLSEALDITSVVMSLPYFVFLYCFSYTGTRDSNCSGALDFISVFCGSFCSIVLFYIVFAMYLWYSGRPSAHKIWTSMGTLCASLFLSINRSNKYVLKYVILIYCQYTQQTCHYLEVSDRSSSNIPIFVPDIF